MGYTQFGDTVIGITKENCVEKAMGLLNGVICKYGRDSLNQMKPRLRIDQAATGAIMLRCLDLSQWRPREPSDPIPSHEENCAAFSAHLEMLYRQARMEIPRFTFCGMPAYDGGVMHESPEVGAMAIDVVEPEQEQ